MCTNQKTLWPPQLLPCPPLSSLVPSLPWFLLLAACPGRHGRNNCTMIMHRSKLVTLPRGPTLQGRPDHGEGQVRGAVPVKFLPSVSTRNSQIGSVPCNIWLLVWKSGEIWHLTIVLVYVTSHNSLHFFLLISFQPPPQSYHLPFPPESPVWITRWREHMCRCVTLEHVYLERGPKDFPEISRRYLHLTFNILLMFLVVTWDSSIFGGFPGTQVGQFFIPSMCGELICSVPALIIQSERERNAV